MTDLTQAPTSNVQHPNSAMGVTARAYRQAVRKHDLGEQDARLIGAVIEYSYEFPGGGRFEAWFPTQRALAMVARLPASSVSEGLDRLAAAHVLSQRKGEKGLWVALEPPACWSLKLRKAGAAIEELDAWLGQAAGETPWLIDMPQTLRELLRENFALSMGESEEVGRSDRSTAASPCTEAPPRDLEGRRRGRLRSGSGGESDTTDRDWEPTEKSSLGTNAAASQKFVQSELVRPERTFSAPSQESAGTTRAAVDRSFKKIVSCKEERSGSGSFSRDDQLNHEGYREYVQSRLFEAVGWEERTGRCQWRWQRYLDLVPEKVDELVSIGLEMQKTRQLRVGLAAFLNGSLGKVLDQIERKRDKTPKNK